MSAIDGKRDVLRKKEKERSADLDPSLPMMRIVHDHAGEVLCLALLSRDGSRLVSGGNEETIRIWNTDTFENVGKLEGHRICVWACAMGDDDTTVSGGGEKNVRLTSRRTGQVERILEGHTDLVRSVAITRNEQRIASSSVDHTVRLWQRRTGECEHVNVTMESRTRHTYGGMVLHP